MNTLSEVDKSWLTATIDGEGHVGMCKAGRRLKDFYYGSRIVVGNTNLAFVRHAQKITGLGRVHPYRSRQLNHKPAFTWAVQSLPEIKEILLAIFPYLIIKRRQAKLLLGMPMKYSRDNYGREKIYKQISSLNRRGVDGFQAAS